LSASPASSDPAQATARAGVDLGGTKIQAVITGAGNAVLGEARRPTPTSGGPKDVAEAIAESVREAAAAAKLEPRSLAGAGVGSPGVVDFETGAVAEARNLPGWEGSYPLGRTLAETLGTPVKVGNDVQVAIDAEFRLGAGRDFQSVLGVFWGTGVGGGIILDGKPWLGQGGGAGEIGHIVIKQDGARCPCGRRGCLEAYAGRAAMEERARREHKKGTKTQLFKIMEKRGRTRLTSGVWARAIKHDDQLAQQLVDRAIVALGTGIASAVNLLAVEAVVIGGGMGSRFGQPYVDRIASEMQPHLFDDEHPPEVKLAGLGDLGGAIGATLLLDAAVPVP
jgi:glucokinase